MKLDANMQQWGSALFNTHASDVHYAGSVPNRVIFAAKNFNKKAKGRRSANFNAEVFHIIIDGLGSISHSLLLDIIGDHLIRFSCMLFLKMQTTINYASAGVALVV
jgi:hypothetical protein